MALHRAIRIGPNAGLCTAGKVTLQWMDATRASRPPCMPSALLRCRTSPILKTHPIQIFNCDGVLQECAGGFLERFEAAYLAELMEFGSCIREDRKLDVRAEDGTATTRIAFALTESNRERRIVKL